MPEHIDPAARLLNLVIALVNTSGRMTKEQIRASVAGYDPTAAPEAFERMFERDKDTLRELGVPVVTVDAGGHTDDVGYRVDLDAYALPPIDLTPAELGVLSLAARLWQDNALHTDTARALTKLRAATGQVSDGLDDVAGLAPRVGPAGAAYLPLLQAIDERRSVRFTYRAASTGEVRARRMEPWRVAVRRGGWYVIGFDRDREAVRAFRLSRIESRVQLVGAPGEVRIPAEVDVDALLGGGGDPVEQGPRVRLAIAPERASALRARAQEPSAARGDAPGEGDLDGDLAGWDVIEVTAADESALADEIAGYADAVVVLSPPSLRQAVLDRLAAAVALAPGGDVHGR